MNYKTGIALATGALAFAAADAMAEYIGNMAFDATVYVHHSDGNIEKFDDPCGRTLSVPGVDTGATIDVKWAAMGKDLEVEVVRDSSIERSEQKSANHTQERSAHSRWVDTFTPKGKSHSWTNNVHPKAGGKASLTARLNGQHACTIRFIGQHR